MASDTLRSGQSSEDPDAVIEAYRRSVDVTLIRENLRRPIEERFRQLMELQRFAEELQRAGRAVRRTA